MALSLADTIMGAVSVFLPLAGAVLLLGYAVIDIPACRPASGSMARNRRGPPPDVND